MLVKIKIKKRFFFQGLGALLEALQIQPSTSSMCKLMLEEGHVLAIAPGGVREALFSDHNYQLIWKERKGFAKVAIEAKAVSVLSYIYEKTRLPLVPIYGIFPVKMITYLGQPIP
ncbi:unnamed protein product, partial [Adineta steineri]